MDNEKLKSDADVEDDEENLPLFRLRTDLFEESQDELEAISESGTAKLSQMINQIPLNQDGSSKVEEPLRSTTKVEKKDESDDDDEVQIVDVVIVSPPGPKMIRTSTDSATTVIADLSAIARQQFSKSDFHQYNLLLNTFVCGNEISTFINSPFLRLRLIGTYVRLLITWFDQGNPRSIFKVARISNIVSVPICKNSSNGGRFVALEYGKHQQEIVEWNSPRICEVKFTFGEYLEWKETCRNANTALPTILDIYNKNQEIREATSRLAGKPYTPATNQEKEATMRSMLTTSFSSLDVPLTKKPRLEFASNSSQNQIRWKPIIVHGTSVALAHGQNKRFSPMGIEICVRKLRTDFPDAKVEVVLPSHFRDTINKKDSDIVDKLMKGGLLSYVKCGVSSYEDTSSIVNYVSCCDGILISDAKNLTTVYNTNSDLNWKRTIRDRVLMFTWVGDVLMFPNDPLGRHGPKLREFLQLS